MITITTIAANLPNWFKRQDDSDAIVSNTVIFSQTLNNNNILLVNDIESKHDFSFLDGAANEITQINYISL